MEKKVCSRVVHELQELLGEDVANDVIYGFLQATDRDLIEFRRALEPIVGAKTLVAR